LKQKNTVGVAQVLEEHLPNKCKRPEFKPHNCQKNKNRTVGVKQYGLDIDQYFDIS
jgi:hypothetical protein